MINFLVGALVAMAILAGVVAVGIVLTTNDNF